ncbi:MAG TPA: SRPBCC family protein [Acetobacteraceae bacterium]|nr:SRPBCC family protein [Acetobacteraceae bacterium]
MARGPEATTGAAVQQLPPLRLSRVFHAPRETVFKAWSSAEHVRRWFSPETFTVPDATVEMRVGGAFDVLMRSPAGEEHWVRGRFVEVAPHARLVIDTHCTDSAGKRLFRAHTAVDFADALGGTRMDVVQTYTLIDPSAAWMVEGAPDGWRSTLDKLEQEVVRMRGGGETGVRSVVHATFDLERSYAAPVARVWQALTDAAAKQKWFGGTPGSWEVLERHMDVRVGGRERLKGRWEGGVVSTFDAVYHDVIPNQRLVYTYEMHLDDKKISVSLATLQLKDAGATTTLKVTEQGAFLDGYDDAGSREQGTGHLLDALARSLED